MKRISNQKFGNPKTTLVLGTIALPLSIGVVGATHTHTQRITLKTNQTNNLQNSFTLPKGLKTRTFGAGIPAIIMAAFGIFGLTIAANYL